MAGEFPSTLISGNVCCPKPQTKTEAFQEAGSKLKSSRGIWSRVEGDTAFVSIWDGQVRCDASSGKRVVDLSFEHPEGDPVRSTFLTDPKHLKRAERLALVRTGEKKLEVIVIFGPIRNGKFWTRWRPEEQDGRKWKVISEHSSENSRDGLYRMEAF